MEELNSVQPNEIAQSEAISINQVERFEMTEMTRKRVRVKQVVKMEESTNPFFKDWDPVLNLKNLKSRVHQIIKVSLYASCFCFFFIFKQLTAFFSLCCYFPEF